jgi:hypothetical protein
LNFFLFAPRKLAIELSLPGGSSAGVAVRQNPGTILNEFFAVMANPPAHVHVFLINSIGLFKTASRS